MNIAFDFHGVLEIYPDVLKPLLTTLKKDHIIIILSGPPFEQIYNELDRLGYNYEHFDDIISVVDWLKNNGVKMKLNENGSWYCDDELWWSSKAKICKEKSINILFDDKLEYKKYIENNNPLFLHIK